MAAHFLGGSAGKEPACNAGDLGWIPESGRPLEGAWQPTPPFLLEELPWAEEAGGPKSVGSQSRM